MAVVGSVMFCVEICVLVSKVGGADGWLAGDGWVVSVSGTLLIFRGGSPSIVVVTRRCEVGRLRVEVLPLRVMSCG